MAARERPSSRKPALYQKWRDLLFLNWAYDPAEIQKTLPEGLFVDTFDGRAYLGIVPFALCDMRMRALWSMRVLPDFLEINVRTYVRDIDGNPGVWFYSLDANQWLAVLGGQKLYHLPYYHAFIVFEKRRGENLFHVAREEAEIFVSHFRWTPLEGERLAKPGSLDFFLLERYRFFAQNASGRLFSGQVYHEPYRIQNARLNLYDENLFPLNGFLQTGLFPDHVACSPGVAVESFSLRELD